MNETTVIAASEAKAKFSELLERTRKGEGFAITLHGEAVAKLVSAKGPSLGDVQAAIIEMKSRRMTPADDSESSRQAKAPDQGPRQSRPAMNFVVDASFALAWVLKDESTVETDKILDLLGRGSKAFVPALWRWEIANALLNVERRKRATKAEVGRHLSLLQSFPIDVDEAAVNGAWNATLLLAQQYGLTSYDAAYLELAIRRGLPLASLDTDLQAAAKAAKVEVFAGK
jgi:prevent-host-death family protein